MRKKGSLQLSINAIVILILAITLLGLGLGFIKKQFGTVTAKFEEASQDIENEVIDKIRQSGDILTFDKARLVVERGKPITFYAGIKNTDSKYARCFKLKFVCQSALTAGNECFDGAEGAPVFVGGIDPYDDLVVGENDIVGTAWFTTVPISVNKLDIQVIPVKVQVPDAAADIYTMRVELYQNNDAYVGDEQGCTNAVQEGSYSESPIQSKQFFLEVK